MTDSLMTIKEASEWASGYVGENGNTQVSQSWVC
jgi:hypothetical protein